MVGDIPFISKENARFLYELIIDRRVTRILELGIAHGTATCYMAAALDELGRGHITAVDLIDARSAFSPSAEELLSRVGFSSRVDIVRMKTGYTWYLHDAIRENTTDDRCAPVYDLCIIDGPKNWTIDGAAFFFVDKLLKPNGWMVFDDYNWTYADADRRRDVTDGISHRPLSNEERNIPHIREVFELLVKQHPDYSALTVLEGRDWAVAQKVSSNTKTYTVLHRHEESYKDILAKVFAKVMRLART